MPKNTYKQKSVDELTFTDDGMFQTVMHNPEICAEVIEKLLHVKVQKVDYPEIEKVIEPYYTTKSIRLDVYLKDDDKIIDVECQSYPQESIGKRTRFYQSLIDTDNLMKGEDYSDLKDSYILFICKKDPFKDSNKKNYGLPCYTFRNICLENNEIELNDKTIKVIYNASAYEEENGEKRDFLHFISTNDPGKDELSNRIANLVEQIKLNEKFRRDYAAMNLHDRDLTRMAKAEGKLEKAIEMAVKNVRKYKEKPEVAAADAGAPLDEVLEALKK